MFLELTALFLSHSYFGVTEIRSPVGKFLLSIWGAPASNLEKETGYFDGIFVAFFGPSGKRCDSISNKRPAASLQALPNSLFDAHPTVRRYTARASDDIFNL